MSSEVWQIGDFSRISPEQEQKILRPIWQQIESQNLRPEMLIKIQDKLKKYLDVPVLVSLTCAKEPNAFALPGGIILLSRGLFQTIESENALVFVIGHEYGHISNRDHVRGLGRHIVFALLSSLVNAGTSHLFGLNTFNELITRRFDQNQELAADRAGLNLVQKVYGHTRGANEFFLSMQAKENILDKSIGRFFSTHPLSSERVKLMDPTSNADKTQNLIYPEHPYSEVANKECLSPTPPTN